MLADLMATLPLGIVAVMGCFILLLDAFGEGPDRRHLGYLSAAGFGAVMITCYLLWGREITGFTTSSFGMMMAMGRFELAACAVLALIGLCVSLMSIEYAEEHGFSYGELYALINFSVFGMMVLATATNLVTVFIGLETMSVAIYILAAIKRGSAFSAESGMKYFVLGAFSTGFLVYGMAFLYGETVRFDYGGIAIALQAGNPSGWLAIAVIMLTVAFGFKIALVPFHMWTPDVYEGAPAPITALMATGVKAAGVLAMGRLFVVALPPAHLGWMGADLFNVLAVLAILTMVVGNLIALHQKNLQRMLAYSSIAHAGYLLVGVMAAHVAADPTVGMGGIGLGGVLFYLFAYALANLAAFAVIGLLGRGGFEDVSLDSVSGLAKRHPVGAAVLAIAMFSLAGVPPTAGFFGKFALFREALRVDAVLAEDKFLWLVIIAMITSVISVYYYLRVVVYAYMRDAVRDFNLIRGRALMATLAITALGTLLVGAFPGRSLKASTQAAAELLPTGSAARVTESLAPVAEPEAPSLATKSE